MTFRVFGRLFWPTFVIGWLTLIAVAWSGSELDAIRYSFEAHSCYATRDFKCAERNLQYALSEDPEDVATHYLMGLLIARSVNGEYRLAGCYTAENAMNSLRVAFEIDQERTLGLLKRDRARFGKIAQSPYFRILLKNAFYSGRLPEEIQKFITGWEYHRYPEAPELLGKKFRFTSKNYGHTWRVLEDLSIQVSVRGKTHAFYLSSVGDLLDAREVEACMNETHPDLRTQGTFDICMGSIDPVYTMWAQRCLE